MAELALPVALAFLSTAFGLLRGPSTWPPNWVLNKWARVWHELGRIGLGKLGLGHWILNWILNRIRPECAILVRIPNEKLHGVETAALVFHPTKTNPAFLGVRGFSSFRLFEGVREIFGGWAWEWVIIMARGFRSDMKNKFWRLSVTVNWDVFFRVDCKPEGWLREKRGYVIKCVYK